MTNVNVRIALLSLVVAICLLAPPASGQVVLNQTTLAAALSATTSTLSVASATGITAPGPNQSALKALVIDKEIVLVSSLTSTTIQVIRGQYGTDRVPHVSGALVFVVPDNAFARGAFPSGSCTRTNLPYVPIVYISPTAGGSTGARFDCLGGQLVRTDVPTSVVGGTVSSATSITPTGTFFVVSGTTPVATIVVPAGWQPGNCLAINPTGIFATTTAANIGLITAGTVVGRILFMCWDGAHWFPSYVS